MPLQMPLQIHRSCREVFTACCHVALALPICHCAAEQLPHVFGSGGNSCLSSSSLGSTGRHRTPGCSVWELGQHPWLKCWFWIYQARGKQWGRSWDNHQHLPSFRVRQTKFLDVCAQFSSKSLPPAQAREFLRVSVPSLFSPARCGAGRSDFCAGGGQWHSKGSVSGCYKVGQRSELVERFVHTQLGVWKKKCWISVLTFSCTRCQRLFVEMGTIA